MLGLMALAFILNPSFLHAEVGDHDGILRRLSAIGTDHQALQVSPQAPEDLSAQLALFDEELRTSISSTGDASSKVEALNHLIFNRLNIKSSHDLEDPANLFLSSVLTRKQGYCVGIASLYLVLAERLELPLFAVATPEHLFLRYDDGTTHINIETFQHGAHLADEQYIREHSIPEKSVRNGVFLRNLTANEFIAQIHNNLGVIYSKRQQYDLAGREYQQALELHPKFPAALYNMANDLLHLGDYRHAVRYFSKSLRLYPTDVWALNNRGLVYEKRGQLRKARRDFEEALRLSPGFSQAAANLKRVDRGPQEP